MSTSPLHLSMQPLLPHKFFSRFFFSIYIDIFIPTLKLYPNIHLHSSLPSFFIFFSHYVFFLLHHYVASTSSVLFSCVPFLLALFLLLLLYLQATKLQSGCVDDPILTSSPEPISRVRRCPYHPPVPSNHKIHIIAITGNSACIDFV